MQDLADLLSERAENLFQTLTNSDQPTSQPVIESTPPVKENLDLTQLKEMVLKLREQADSIVRYLDARAKLPALATTASAQPSPALMTEPTVMDHQPAGTKIIEGVFNGEQMIGPDGHVYTIPQNYASKSKLVEGDFLKLTITPTGQFIYKQIGPVARKRVVGKLTAPMEATGTWSVFVEEKPFKILTASVTFYRGRTGEEVVILIPEDGQSSWGAVENIIHT